MRTPNQLMVYCILAIGLVALFVGRDPRLTPEQKVELNLEHQLMPPGGDSISWLKPVPVAMVEQVGAHWILATFDKGKYRTVVYYPNTLNVRGVNCIATSALDQQKVFEYHVINVATTKDGQRIQIAPFTVATCKDRDAIFMGVDPRNIEKLKKELLSKKPQQEVRR